VLEMGTPILRRSRASRTTERTELDSYQISLRPVHSKSISSYFVSHLTLSATAQSVTAVGGTTSIPEVAAELSGGGFSNIVSFTHFIRV
jgi:hypothetical protein